MFDDILKIYSFNGFIHDAEKTRWYPYSIGPIVPFNAMILTKQNYDDLVIDNCPPEYTSISPKADFYISFNRNL